MPESNRRNTQVQRRVQDRMAYYGEHLFEYPLQEYRRFSLEAFLMEGTQTLWSMEPQMVYRRDVSIIDRDVLGKCPSKTRLLRTVVHYFPPHSFLAQLCQGAIEYCSWRRHSSTNGESHNSSPTGAHLPGGQETG